MEEQISIEDQLKPYIDAIISKEDLRHVKYEVKSGSNTGDNYVGIVYRVVLTGQRRDGQAVTKSLIYKCQPDNEVRRNQFHTQDMFDNEARFYNDVLPTFLAFLDQKGLKNEFKSFPTKCYHAGDALLIEDMCQYGFTMQNRKNTLDVAHCQLVLRELGKLHAISYAFRDQRPEEFKRLANTPRELVMRDDDMLRTHCTLSSGKAIEKFMNTAKLDNLEHYKEKLDKFHIEYLDSMIEIVKGEIAEPYAVINHGDCWTNNLLFKYSEESPIPDELCMIDFQIIRYSSPVNDIVYFLYCCTDQNLRNEHYDHLISEYYESLSRFLTQLGSNPEKLFPFSALQDQLQRFSKFGLGMALLTIPLFTCNAEDLPDFNAAEKETDAAEQMLAFENTNDNVATARMNGVLIEMVDKKFIE